MSISDRWQWRLCGLCVVVFLVLSVSFALRRAPWNDEGWFACASLNLAQHGFLGSTVIEPTGTHLAFAPEGIQQYTYWVLPVYLVFQALWYKLIGFSFFTMRASSILFGLSGLAAFHFAARKLTSSQQVAWIGTSLLALDTLYMNVSAFGRMDMMAVALGWIALALYLGLRETNLNRAVAASYTALAFACFTHHQAALAGIALTAAAIWLDRKRLRFAHLILAGIPFLLLGVLWGLYAAQHPDYFWTQLRANGSGRLATLLQPLLALWREVVLRYGVVFGFEAGSHPARKLLVLVPIGYLLSIAGGLFWPELRRRPYFRFLCIVLALQVAFQFVFEGMKLSLYLIHLTPWYTLIVAVFAVAAWEQKAMFRKPVAALVIMMAAVQLGASVLLVAKNNYHRRVAPLVRILEPYNRDGSLIVGPPELGLEIGFDHLVDDLRVGYYSHRRPDVIVLDGRYLQWLEHFRTGEPSVWLHISTLLSQYPQVYGDNGFRVHAARPVTAPPSASR